MASMSPLSWYLMINQAFGILDWTGVKVVVYADDVMLLTRGKCLQTISVLTKIDLAKLPIWTM